MNYCIRIGVGATGAKSGKFRSQRGLLQGSVLSPVLFNKFLQAVIDEVTRRLEVAGITGGVIRVRHDGKELKWPPAGIRTGEMVGVC